MDVRDTSTWSVQKSGEDYDIVVVYGKNPSYFTMEFHHGGEFSEFADTIYHNGTVNFIDMVDSHRFSISIVHNMLEKLGYAKEYVKRQHFKIPGEELDFGLRPLANEIDVSMLTKYVKKYKVIEVYVEHVRDDEDCDFIVDKDNLVEDVNVDMAEFGVAVDYEGEDLVIDEELVDDDLDLDNFDSLSDSGNEPPLEAALSSIRKKKKKSKLSFDCPFYLGQAFGSRDDIRAMVKKHAIDCRRQLYNDKDRFHVVCLGINPSMGICESNKEGTKQGYLEIGTSKSTKSKPKKKIRTPTCPWRLHITNQKREGSWVVKTLINEHYCLQTRDVKLCTISWLAKEIEPTIRVNPSIPLRALQEILQEKFQVQVTSQKIFRAKMLATKTIQGDYKAQYEILRDYCEELVRSNPGTTVKIDVERECNPSSQTRQFRRIYICLGGLKVGFKMCGRELLGLDGCFIKGPYPGQILTTVGVDANNGIYPVAYSIVESESASSWTWFLECLRDDLDLSSNSNFTFISDRQKGIIPAISKVFSNAEHRYCLRHIHENMKQKWSGQVYKELVWKCASATTIQRA